MFWMYEIAYVLCRIEIETFDRNFFKSDLPLTIYSDSPIVLNVRDFGHDSRIIS